MYIYELPVGSHVNLEMAKDSSVYEVTTTVLGSSETQKYDGQVLLSPIKYKGKVLDLGNRKISGLKFNLYGDDEKGNRLIWPDVSVVKKDYKDQVFYVVKANMHHLIGLISDRRDNHRQIIDMPALITNHHLNLQLEVTVHDISVDGISIVVNNELDIMNQLSHMILYDRILSVHNEFELDFRPIRTQTLDDGRILYGCKAMDERNMTKIYSYFKNAVAMQFLAENGHLVL